MTMFSSSFTLHLLKPTTMMILLRLHLQSKHPRSSTVTFPPQSHHNPHSTTRTIYNPPTPPSPWNPPLNTLITWFNSSTANSPRKPPPIALGSFCHRWFFKKYCFEKIYWDNIFFIFTFDFWYHNIKIIQKHQHILICIEEKYIIDFFIDQISLDLAV